MGLGNVAALFFFIDILCFVLFWMKLKDFFFCMGLNEKCLVSLWKERVNKGETDKNACRCRVDYFFTFVHLELQSRVVF